MYGKKIIVSVIISVILIAIAGNMHIVLANNSVYNEISPQTEGIIISSWKHQLLGMSNLTNYVFAIINSLVLIINKKNVSKEYFRTILVLSIIFIFISDAAANIIRDYGGALGYEPDLGDIIWDYMPVFILILQIAISIITILKLRKGKNQPKCEKV